MLSNQHNIIIIILCKKKLRERLIIMNANFSKLILKLMEDNNLSKELVLKRINKTSKEFDEMLISDNLTYSDIYNISRAIEHTVMNIASIYVDSLYENYDIEVLDSYENTFKNIHVYNQMLYDEFIKNVNEENVEAILNSISLGILVRRFDGEFVFGRVKNFIQVPHDVMKKLIMILLKNGFIHYARRCSSQIIYLNESDLARFNEAIRYDYLLGKEGSTFSRMSSINPTRVDFFVDAIVEYELDEANKLLHEGLFRIYKKDRLISKEKIIGINKKTSNLFTKLILEAMISTGLDFKGLVKRSGLDKKVVKDKNVITAKSVYYATPFALEIIEKLQGKEQKLKIEKEIIVHNEE